MKKLFYTFAIAFTAISLVNIQIKAEETASKDMVTIEIPASEIKNIDVKYQKKEESVTDKFIKSSKEVAKDTANSTKSFTDKTIKATKNATKKTVKATKEVTDKTVKATKRATDKTVKTTKDVTNKTVEETKNFIENINPSKPITAESLKQESSLKTLKNEKKEIKSAYNSRIKDIDAKIKSAEKSTLMDDVQKRNRIYMLNKEKQELIIKRDNTIEEYNLKIKELKSK